MLIEALASLAEKAGAERISMEVSPSNGKETAVLVITSMGQNAVTGESEKHGRLLAALSRPLVVRGHPGELDSRLVNLIDKIEESVVNAAHTLPETDAQKLRKELAAAKDKPEGESVRTSGKDESRGGESAKDHAEALADGEADSL